MDKTVLPDEYKLVLVLQIYSNFMKHWVISTQKEQLRIEPKMYLLNLDIVPCWSASKWKSE